MRYLNKITSDAIQRFFLTGNPGQSIVMVMRYLPTQMQWIMDIEYGDFIARGIHVVTSPNILRNYKNVIPFGMACLVNDGLDPAYPDDFAEGRAALYLLNSDDVQTVEEMFK